MERKATKLAATEDLVDPTITAGDDSNNAIIPTIHTTIHGDKSKGSDAEFLAETVLSGDYYRVRLILMLQEVKESNWSKPRAQRERNTQQQTRLHKMGKKTRKLRKLAAMEDLIDPSSSSSSNIDPTITTQEDGDWDGSNDTSTTVPGGSDDDDGDKYYDFGSDSDKLLQAAKNGNYFRVQELLLEGTADVHTKDCFSKRTPFHCACSKGHLEVAKLLLAHGAELITRDIDGNTPLHSACSMWGYSAVIEFLVEESSNHGKNAINIQNNDGLTPLLVCCWRGDYTDFNLLLKNGADLKPVRKKDGSTALHLACRFGNFGVARSLVQIGVNVNAKDKDGWTPLFWSVWRGNNSFLRDDDCPIFKLLVENGANVNAQDNYGASPLEIALRHNGLFTNIEVMKQLLKNGGNVNMKLSNGDTPLEWVCRNNGLDSKTIIQLLVKYGADPNAQTKKNGKTLFHWACGHDGPLNVFKALLENGADPNSRVKSNGKTPLHWVCSNGNFEKIKLLLEKGADPNAKGKNLETRLHWACRKGRLDVVKLLLHSGAKVAAKTTHGLTPFHVAAERNQSEVVWYLVQQYPWLLSESL